LLLIQVARPYVPIIEANEWRDKKAAEYELLDTGIFDEDRYAVAEASAEIAKETDAPEAVQKKAEESRHAGRVHRGKERAWQASTPTAEGRLEATSGGTQALLSTLVIPTRTTAPMNATTIPPTRPPPALTPSLEKIQPPSTPPRIPRMMSANTP